MPSVFKIPECIADKYHGSGYAMCSVTGNEVINLVYLRDVLPEFDDANFQQSILEDARIGPAVRILQSTGEVYFGMCSCWEFVEL